MTRGHVDSDGARVSVLECGHSGRPLLLVHSINAAASAAEVEPLRVHFQKTRHVITVDLPGFGESDRSDRRYTPRLMTDALLDVARWIVARDGIPLDALALSLSCEFLARAAAEAPALFRSVAFVSPTGFTGRRSLRGAPGTTRAMPWLYALLTGPGWGAQLFGLLTRPGVIRYFLERTWGSRNIDPQLLRADIMMSRYPGAHHAPLYFLSAALFSADIHTVYESIAVPVWASHGRRGDFTDYRQLRPMAARRSWRVTGFDTGALPYFEDLEAFAAEYEAFMSHCAGAAAGAGS